MTTNEAQALVRKYNARYGIDLLNEKTLEALKAQYIALKAQLVKDEEAAEQATKFRPAYAPVGRETRTEIDTKIVVRWTQFAIDATKAAYNLKAAGN